MNLIFQSIKLLAKIQFKWNQKYILGSIEQWRNQIKFIKFMVLCWEAKQKSRRKRGKKFDLYKVNYSLMINITTESNQSFTTEMEEKVSPDFFLFQLLIILSRRLQRSGEKNLCQFHLNFNNLFIFFSYFLVNPTKLGRKYFLFRLNCWLRRHCVLFVYLSTDR